MTGEQLRLPGFERFAIPDWIRWNHADPARFKDRMDWAWVAGKGFCVELPWHDSSTVVVHRDSSAIYGTAPENATFFPSDVIRTVLPVREWPVFRGYAVRIIEALVERPHLYTCCPPMWESMELLVEALEIAPLVLSGETPRSTIERLCADAAALQLIRSLPSLDSDRRLLLASRIGHLYLNDPARLRDHLDVLLASA